MKRLFQDRSTPLVYMITDRRLLPPRATDPDLTLLIEFANRAVTAGVDMVQIRERDLSARDVLFVTESIAESAHRTGTRVLINDRVDIATSAGAGVHLTTRSLTAEVVRAGFGTDTLVGVSTHSFDDVRAAEHGGAEAYAFQQRRSRIT